MKQSTKRKYKDNSAEVLCTTDLTKDLYVKAAVKIFSTMMATTTTILIIPVMLDDWIMTVKVIEDCKQQLPRAQ